MSVARLDVWKATVARWLVEKKMLGEYCQTEYVETYRRMEETATKKLIGIVREFLKHYSWKAVSVEENKVASGERREAVMAMSRTATSIWTVPSSGKAFILVDERGSQTFVTYTPGSVSD